MPIQWTPCLQEAAPSLRCLFKHLLRLEYRQKGFIPSHLWHSLCCDLTLHLFIKHALALLVHFPSTIFLQCFVTSSGIRSLVLKRGSPATQALAQWQEARLTVVHKTSLAQACVTLFHIYCLFITSPSAAQVMINQSCSDVNQPSCFSLSVNMKRKNNYHNINILAWLFCCNKMKTDEFLSVTPINSAPDNAHTYAVQPRL